MKRLIFAVLLVCIAVPAFAQDATPPPVDPLATVPWNGWGRLHAFAGAGQTYEMGTIEDVAQIAPVPFAVGSVDYNLPFGANRFKLRGEALRSLSGTRQWQTRLLAGYSW